MVADIAKSADLTQAQVRTVLTGFEEHVTKHLKDSGKVVMPGFLIIEVKNRAERNGRNPKTGAAMVIPAKRVVHIRAGKTLQDSIA
jgi:DNA-binding protein HU-beta